MISIYAGQCGLCVHFGEGHASTKELIQIRSSHDAPPTYVDSCGHPTHAHLHLRVTPTSGCDAFEAAA